jgi:phosphatidylglycerol:prolipoprotein diacylglycerol transferase
MTVAINPVLLSFGPLAVRWFGVLALLGLGVAIWLSLREVERQGLSRRLALDALAWGLPAGILVARPVNVLGAWDYYLTHAGQLWQLNLDGLSLWGGLLGGALIAAQRLKRDPTRRRRILDAIVPYAALGIAIGRIGQFIDGAGQGLPSALPWAAVYTSPLAATPDFGVPRHPAQLYDALVAFALFGLLKALPRGMRAGTATALFLVAYGGARVILGYVRLDPAFLFGLQIEQLLALGGMLFGIAYGLRPALASRLARSRIRAGANGEQAGVPAEDSLAA